MVEEVNILVKLNNMMILIYLLNDMLLVKQTARTLLQLYRLMTNKKVEIVKYSDVDTGP